jgi:hypothetical protein
MCNRQLARAVVKNAPLLRGHALYGRVYLQEGLTKQQQEVRQQYMQHSAALHAARARKARIDWRGGVPWVWEVGASPADMTPLEPGEIRPSLGRRGGGGQWCELPRPQVRG